jgi:hypothetical protein
MLPRVGIWAPAGAVIGLLLGWVAGSAEPVVSLLGAGALVGIAAYAWGDRDATATLTIRLLLAAVYVTIGATHPTPLGITVGILGASFGVLACRAARRSAAAEALRARLLLSVRSPDGTRSAEIEVMGAASARVAARRSVKALGLAPQHARWRLERCGRPLHPDCGLCAAGVRSGDVLTLASAVSDEVAKSPPDRIVIAEAQERDAHRRAGGRGSSPTGTR